MRGNGLLAPELAPGQARVKLRDYAGRLGVPYGTAANWCLDGSFQAKTGHRPVKIAERWYVDVPSPPTALTDPTTAAGVPGGEAALLAASPFLIPHLRRSIQDLTDLVDWLEAKARGGPRAPDKRAPAGG